MYDEAPNFISDFSSNFIIEKVLINLILSSSELKKLFLDCQWVCRQSKRSYNYEAYDKQQEVSIQGIVKTYFFFINV